ncbi:translation initiation factor-like protein eIF-2B subunit beta [Xylogone sp. PMI_703]|nr:translation initiation factor-like protein eIF-2B subunit beta [Xylogone sp. PMI_703]
MATSRVVCAQNLAAFTKSLKTQSLESSIEYLISLLKRRQISNSRSCAIATAQLLLRVVAKFRWTDVGKLLLRIQHVGQRLIEAQPRETAVGNVVRRVLGMIRDEAKEDRNEEYSDSGSNTQSPLSDSNEDAGSEAKSHTSRPSLLTSHTSYGGVLPSQQSMFNLLSTTPSPSSTPITSSPSTKPLMNPASLTQRISTSSQDLKAEIISGIEEIIDELLQVDEQIAAYAQEHIHSNEIILTHTSSVTVQKFLLKAAEKRKFTVIVAESYPNEHMATHASVTGKPGQREDGSDEILPSEFVKPLAAAGITVILMTDATIFAIMSRVNKVILATHAVIANGGLIAAAGARLIAKAAKVHRTPVIVVSGVYKLSPEYPFEFDSLIEYGNPGSIIDYGDGALVDSLEVDNPLFDYVPPDLVDLYITNLGAHAPSYLYRIVADHYRPEDINFNKPELQF